jgi:hypothetical protein
MLLNLAKQYSTVGIAYQIQFLISNNTWVKTTYQSTFFLSICTATNICTARIRFSSGTIQPQFILNFLSCLTNMLYKLVHVFPFVCHGTYFSN